MNVFDVIGILSIIIIIISGSYNSIINKRYEYFFIVGVTVLVFYGMYKHYNLLVDVVFVLILIYLLVSIIFYFVKKNKNKKLNKKENK